MPLAALAILPTSAASWSALFGIHNRRLIRRYPLPPPRAVIPGSSGTRYPGRCSPGGLWATRPCEPTRGPRPTRLGIPPSLAPEFVMDTSPAWPSSCELPGRVGERTPETKREQRLGVVDFGVSTSGLTQVLFDAGLCPLGRLPSRLASMRVVSFSA